MELLNVDEKERNLLRREPAIIQFLVEIFFVYFLPLVIGFFYFLLTSPWFDTVFLSLEDPFVSWLMKGIVFTAIVFIVIRVYIFAVIG
jgi:hypothetical protein